MEGKIVLGWELQSYCVATPADHFPGPITGPGGPSTRSSQDSGVRQVLGKRSLARAGRDLLRQVWSGGVPRTPAGLPSVPVPHLQEDNSFVHSTENRGAPCMSAAVGYAVDRGKGIPHLVHPSRVHPGNACAGSRFGLGLMMTLTSLVHRMQRLVGGPQPHQSAWATIREYCNLGLKQLTFTFTQLWRLAVQGQGADRFGVSRGLSPGLTGGCLLCPCMAFSLSELIPGVSSSS